MELRLDECFYLGYVRKAHGLKGELEIVLDVDSPEKYKKKESILVEMHHGLVPFFIESLSLRGTNGIVKFQNVNSPDDQDRLIGKQLYLPLTELPPLKGKKQFYYHEIVGYSVIDAEKGPIGIVHDVYDHPRQALISIHFQEKEILIPVTDGIIQEVNRATQTLHIQTPEGLIDLYLG